MRAGRPESASRCDQCGKVETDRAVGFSLGLLGMRHDCGGTWRRGTWVRATGEWQPLREPRHAYGHDPDDGF